jgi:hypothetical protein
MEKKTLFEWIREKLIEMNGDIDKVALLRKKCVEEIGKGGGYYSSFHRRIREVVSELKTSGEWEKLFPPTDYSGYSREEIVSLLSEKVIELKEKISLIDIKGIIEENGIPEGALFELVPDYAEIVKVVYENNMFHLKDDIKKEKTKIKLSKIMKENTELKKRILLMDELNDRLGQLATFYKKPKKVNFIKSNKREKEAVLSFSDTHFGEEVDPKEIMNINAYNTTIAKERIDILFNSVIEYCQLYKVTKLNIHMLGDMISGNIHAELLETNELTTVETIIYLSDYVSMWIQKLSEYFKVINLLGISGNHGRISDKPRYKKKNQNNFDFLMYKFMEKSISGIVNSFILPDSFLYLTNHLGYRILNLHGDILKGGTGLNPVSGTWARDSAKLNGLLRQHGREFDCMLFGHFHTGDTQFPSFDKTKIIVNGSVKGTDQFSLGAVKTGTKPSQQLLIIDEKGIDVNKTIYLD